MKRTLIAPALALAALGTAQAAQAQQSCVAPADVTDMVTYVVPLAFDAAMQTCDAQYQADGFMKSDGDAFADRFRAKQDAAWPGAYKLGKQFMAKRAEKEGEEGNGNEADIVGLIDQMPEEQVRPFFDGIIQQMIASEIKTDTCGDIERGLGLLAPLPVENTSMLVTFILEMSGVKDPQICSN
ncbi:hypothetical protein [Erythrobacter sp. YT30]|uniref:hypothetical protein n=1 Tax=Erythrobacter sp. YT30 TaxID=1735012 RepID=UPI00076D3C23|nr:hypothetical protein [Erythrobacter sp. YT30]KWV93002.1 hypothetical protein AUC45_02355 [Erythrobacter sp. YT30]